MLIVKYLLLAAGAALGAYAAVILVFDLALIAQYHLLRVGAQREGTPVPALPVPVRWPYILRLGLLASAPVVVAMSIFIVGSGRGGVRVSATRGTESGTLYPGVHLIWPLVESVETFDLRDKLFTAGEPASVQGAAPVAELSKLNQLEKPGVLNVQSKEGLNIGLAVTVRYRLDPKRLDYIQSHLPQPVDTELVPSVVASAWRELAPGYTVRELFSSRREEVRQKAADTITRKLGSDGLIVKEVMLRDVQLPPEYAKGLNDLLLKEQQDDQLNIQTDMQAKQVKIRELEAEADKVQKVKAAEAEAQAKVIEAKSESDAMQYTLPLKEKQIQQTKLEAEARKESTIQNAEAEAEAKVIDSKAEQQRRNLLTESEANRIRITAAADQVRMQGEAAVLRDSPLLINKIVAERLSDKIQVMMVPNDGKFFFANDVFKSYGTPGGPTTASPNMARQQMIEEDTGRGAK